MEESKELHFMPPKNMEGKENYKFTIFENFIIITDSARL